MRQYSIHEIARLFHISADAIRLYEKEGLVKSKRREANGYRYYELEQIHRIMGVALWRKLDVGLAEIKHLFQVTSFQDMTAEFQYLIEENEKEIDRLQHKVKQMKFMQQHVKNLGEGIGTCSLRELPGRYVTYEHPEGKVEYESIAGIIGSPLFSFGNFCFTLHRENNKYCTDKLQFQIREPMFALSPVAEQKAELEWLEGCRCIYTVCDAPELGPVPWDLEYVFEYAKKQGLKLQGPIYVFYVFSLISDHGIRDYYEIYLPLKE